MVGAPIKMLQQHALTLLPHKKTRGEMGNCQAIDNAAVLIQHPNGRTDKLFAPVAATEVMKANPGHYVALLLTTTTVYSASAAAGKDGSPPENKNKSAPLRITRIKLLRQTDALALGHVYRLVTTQEVMKGLWAKKQQQKQGGKKMTTTTTTMREKNSSDFEAAFGETTQVNEEKEMPRNKKAVSSKYRGAWQPALKSISESAT